VKLGAITTERPLPNDSPLYAWILAAAAAAADEVDEPGPRAPLTTVVPLDLGLPSSFEPTDSTEGAIAKPKPSLRRRLLERGRKSRRRRSVEVAAAFEFSTNAFLPAHQQN
jgi:hypothetical protein